MMDGFWQDRINDELRTLRRAEAWEQLTLEDQGLRAGHLDQQPVVVLHRPGTRVRWSWVALSRILVSRWRTRRAPMG
jgi:hypothetical protein